MQNLSFISQAGWRVRIVHYVAKAIGLLIHVEGIPFGSNRHYPRKFRRQVEVGCNNPHSGRAGSWMET